ncbi:hypothetical protein JNUCC42_13325 [Brevibacterium sp. JNUCC-42]|nr:hypothetical protein JNUCC42_13325 [Brevibacterium sp. JNUCC-42]
MVTSEQLLQDEKYRFNNLTINILEKDFDDNVYAFSATYVSSSHDGKLSAGLKEVNQLWNSGSESVPQDTMFLPHIRVRAGWKNPS